MTSSSSSVTATPPKKIHTNDLHQRHEKVYTRSTKGKFQRARRMVAWPLLALYLILPWISYNQRPVIWFDLTELHFHIFNITLWAQELYLLSFILMIAAFGLFAVTSWSGRVWCGFSCPQTVWTSIFIYIERQLEGSRNSQIKRDHAKLNKNTVLLKLAKHSLWLLISFITGFTFVAYFTPANELIASKYLFSLESFWIAFFTLATYINAGYMREQVCKYMCPYSRFQSVMVTSATQIVSYDQPRGEPRQKLRHSVTDPSAGDCISCQQCVHVCPVGIDIRQGVQMDCINCGLCIDACDDVMKKVGRDTELIKFQSEDQLKGSTTKNNFQLRGYILICLVLSACLGYQLLTRIPLAVDIERERGRLYLLTDTGNTENLYNLKIMNRDQIEHQYTISVNGLDEATIQGPKHVTVDTGKVHHIALRLSVPTAALEKSSIPIQFEVTAQKDQTITITEGSRFLSE